MFFISTPNGAFKSYFIKLAAGTETHQEVNGVNIALHVMSNLGALQGLGAVVNLPELRMT